jgi:hypothetical protein
MAPLRWHDERARGLWDNGLMVPQQLRDVGELEPGRVESLDLGTYHTPLTTLIATIYRVETSELKRTDSSELHCVYRPQWPAARTGHSLNSRLAGGSENSRTCRGRVRDLVVGRSTIRTWSCTHTMHNPAQGNSEEHSGLCNCLVPLCFN